jgi:hypothetical protein
MFYNYKSIFYGLKTPGLLYYLLNMSFFCLLWVPLFYLFWRSVSGNNTVAGGVWAILVGSIVAMIQFFLGNFVDPGGFELSRWISGCIDIVTLPALAPIVIYFFLISFKFVSGEPDFTNFTLLWLIPSAALRALSWSSLRDPLLLVLVPVLWTAIAVGVSFFINIILKSRLLVIIPSFLVILIIPFAASCSYWAFFAQKTYWGLLFLFAAVAPMLVSVILSFIRAQD